MKVTSLLLVGLNSAARNTAADAAQADFPAAVVADPESVTEALARPASEGNEVLVLFDPDEKSLTEAETAANGSGGPRWAIVAIGGASASDNSNTISLTAEEWNAKNASRVIRAAVRLHLLECENAKLRGDLSTIGRRISHDLRAPLSGIYSAVDAINESASGSAADRAIFTQAISSSTDELVQLIDRVSFLLKVSAESHEKETTLMGEIVFGTLQRLEKTTLKKGAVITQPANWPVVNGHAANLEVIWTNLISNALRHGGEKPKIDLGWSELDDEYRFWVEDQGPGVREDKVNRLFQPFNLLHKLNATRGIGLALVRRLVDLEGGKCGYEPRAGGGARFYFTLPAGKIPTT